MEESPQRLKGEAVFSRFRTKKIVAWAAGLLLLSALIVLILVCAAVGTFRYLYDRAPDPIISWQVDKTVKAGISSWSPVEVAAHKTIPVRLSKILEANVPFKQDVDIWVDKDITVPLDVTLLIPIDQEIFVETEVPIETDIPLDGVQVQTSLWGLKNITFPLSGTFPLDITIPFKRPVHVKTQAEIHIQQEVTVHVAKQFTFPLDLEARVRLPIDDVFEVSLPENVTVDARLPEKIPVEVQLDLDLSKQDFFSTDKPGKQNF